MALSLADLEAETSRQRLENAMRQDESRLAKNAWLGRWLFADALAARGERKEMSFLDYEGPQHLSKFFGWLRGTRFPDYLPAERVEPLVHLSIERDMASLQRLGVAVPEAWVAHVARYNAQDWCFQRLYPVPEHQKIKTLLDFGAGHGRMANLAFADTGMPLERYIAVDAIPSTYLTQRAYFHAQQLDLLDYIDAPSGQFSNEMASSSHQVVHLPTWRLDLVPDASVDMVCCVQVLKELPRRLADWAIGQFGRIVKPGGAIYVRDHQQFHSPSHMPIETVLAANGFILEFAPAVQDRTDIHGLPRIWRRYDVRLLLRHDD